MSVYFIDISEFTLEGSSVHEICAIKSSNVFHPIYIIGKECCRICFLSKVDINKIFYVNADKYNLVKEYFPSIRLISYQCHAQVPKNINCFWSIHEDCAYRNCMKICIDYLNDVE